MCLTSRGPWRWSAPRWRGGRAGWPGCGRETGRRRPRLGTGQRPLKYGREPQTSAEWANCLRLVWNKLSHFLEADSQVWPVQGKKSPRQTDLLSKCCHLLKEDRIRDELFAYMCPWEPPSLLGSLCLFWFSLTAQVSGLEGLLLIQEGFSVLLSSRPLKCFPTSRSCPCFTEG